MTDIDIRRAERFAEAVKPLIEAFKLTAEALKSISEFRVPDIQSAKWYAMAGPTIRQ